jgi:hypothetical protein
LGIYHQHGGGYPKKEAKDCLEAMKGTAKRLGYSLKWEVKKETG